MQIRFQRGGAYNSDIRSLRDRIRANGTLVNCLQVALIHPNATGVSNFFINLAFQANPQEPPANASVYTIAFSNNNGGFRFRMNPPLPWGGTCNIQGRDLTEDGSYASLGYPHPPFPSITDANLGAAVSSVANYNGGVLQKQTKDALTRLIIAVNEAIRFGDVENGVAKVLGNTNEYQPPWDQIHNWGGHTLG